MMISVQLIKIKAKLIALYRFSYFSHLKDFCFKADFNCALLQALINFTSREGNENEKYDRE